MSKKHNNKCKIAVFTMILITIIIFILYVTIAYKVVKQWDVRIFITFCLAMPILVLGIGCYLSSTSVKLNNTHHLNTKRKSKQQSS